MKFIGAHVSASGGVEAAPVNASEIGANAFALFTKNQRQWVARPLTEESIRVFKENCGKLGFDSRYIYGAQNETYIEGWEKKTSNLLIYKRLCNV